MKFKKIIVSTIMLFSIVYTQPRSEAIFSNTINQLIDNVAQFASYVQDAYSYVETAAQKYLDNQLIVKEYGLDTAAQVFAKKAMKDIQKQTFAWAKSGFKGSPTFIDKPEVFFGNLAVTELRGVTAKLKGDLSYANRSIAAELILSTKDKFELALTPTIDLSVRNDICNETKTAFLVKQSTKTANSDEEDVRIKQAIQKEYIEKMCSGEIDEEKYQALKKCFKNDFYCGGWKSFLATNQDSSNNEKTRLQKAQEEYYKNREKKEQDIKDDLARGEGFLSIETCPDDKYADQEKKEGCLNPVYTTPGKIIADSVGSFVTSPVRQGELVDEINEVLGAAVTGFINGLTEKGFSAIAGGVNDVADQIDDTITDFDSSLADVVNTLPPAPTGQTQLQPGDLTNAERQQIVGALLPGMRSTLTEHKLAGDSLRKEQAFYQGYVNYVNQIPKCYVDKRAEEEEYIRNGQKTPPASIVIPSDVNAYLNDRLAYAQNKLSSVNAEVTNYQKNLTGLENAIRFLETARNGDQIRSVYEAYNRDTSAQKYLTRVASDLRYRQNTDIFAAPTTDVPNNQERVQKGILAEDMETTAKSYLEACQRIDARTYRSDGSGSGGEEFDDNR